MPEASKVKNIVIHCSAGFSGRAGIEAFWKSKGWRNPGYHRLIERDGTIHNLADFSKITNGVSGYNGETIHICYVGGIENIGTKEAPIYKARDTRTAEQLVGLHRCIQEAIFWLRDNGKNITHDLGIVGHRDYSRDQNANGAIESWERIKECPSFDVMAEFSFLYATKDRYFRLPTT